MKLATTIVVRFVVTVLAITAIVGQLAYLDALSGVTLGLAGQLGQNARPSFFAVVAADAIVSIVSGILAITLVSRGDQRPGARGLAVALGAWAYMLAYSGVGLLLRPEAGLPRAVFDAHFPLIEVLGLAGLIYLTAMFPGRLSADKLDRPDDLPVGLRTLQRLRVWLLEPYAPWIATVVVLGLLMGANALTGDSPADVALSPAMHLVRFLAIALVVLNLRRSWEVGSAEERAGIWWLLVGFALLVGLLTLLIGGNILLSATGWPDPPFAWRPILLDLGIIGFLWGLAMAVFYTGEIDAARTARRIVALAGLGTIGLVGATGLEVLLSSALVARVSLPPGLGTIIAVLIVVSTGPRMIRAIEALLDQVEGVDAPEA